MARIPGVEILAAGETISGFVAFCLLNQSVIKARTGSFGKAFIRFHNPASAVLTHLKDGLE